MRIRQQYFKLLLIAGGAVLSVYIYRNLSEKQKKRFIKSMKFGAAEFIGYLIPYLQKKNRAAGDLQASEPGEPEYEA